MKRDNTRCNAVLEEAQRRIARLPLPIGGRNGRRQQVVRLRVEDMVYAVLNESVPVGQGTNRRNGANRGNL